MHFGQIYQIQASNLALSRSSASLGTPLLNMMPRFILAGSNAQFDNPIKPTRLGSDVVPDSSVVAVPSSNRGCSVFKGIKGESSANPISSNTTTDTNLFKSLSF